MHESLAQAKEKISRLKENIERVILGKGEVIDLLLAGFFARGHVLITDIPGIGKTTLAHALAKSVHCSFHRIQFTSDLLPADITGVTIYNPEKRDFEFKPGPLFASVVLADEINRTTPKTQSALLEGMNEFQVSVDSRTYDLPQPFIVLATQNPLEFEGTYPLPESQLDRFMLSIKLGYPSTQDEIRIITNRTQTDPVDSLEAVMNAEEVLEIQRDVEKVRFDPDLADYLIRLVDGTRSSPGILLGVSPRGSLHFYRATQAYALVMGRDFVTPDDIKEIAPHALAHRLLVKRQLDLGSRSTEEARIIVQEILGTIPVPD